MKEQKKCTELDIHFFLYFGCVKYRSVTYTKLSNSIQTAYINNNESLPINVPYSFSIGNMIAIRITYTSQLENFTPVPYKCFLKLV